MCKLPHNYKYQTLLASSRLPREWRDVNVSSHRIRGCSCHHVVVITHPKFKRLVVRGIHKRSELAGLVIVTNGSEVTNLPLIFKFF